MKFVKADNAEIISARTRGFCPESHNHAQGSRIVFTKISQDRPRMHTGSHRGALVVDGGLQTAATKHYCVSVMDLLSCADNEFFFGGWVPKCHQLFVFTLVAPPPLKGVDSSAVKT